MHHISDALGKKKYRYTGSKKYRERMHQKKCASTQDKLALQLRKLHLEHKDVELKEFNAIIQKVYDTYPPEQQDEVIEKILKARLLMGKK